MMVRYDTTWLVVQQNDKVTREKPKESLDVQPVQQQDDTPSDTTAKK
jgi:hypothetical protein